MTKNDPDIVRWSQIKSVVKKGLIHWFWWTVVYGTAGYLGDMYIYNDYTPLQNFGLLLIFSGIMVPITTGWMK